MLGSMKRVWFLYLLATLLALFSPAVYAQSGGTTHTGAKPISETVGALLRHVGGMEKHVSKDPPPDSAIEDRRD